MFYHSKHFQRYYRQMIENTEKPDRKRSLMKQKEISITVVMLIIIAGICFGEEVSREPALSSWGWFTLGKIVKAERDDIGTVSSSFQGEWLANFDAGLKYTKPVGKYSKGRFHVGVEIYYNVYQDKTANASEFLQKKIVPYIIDATLQSTIPIFGGRDTLGSEFGYFPVKYNQQVTNFGEYLFRSGTYPAYLFSGFELADKVKLCGLHLSYKTSVLAGFKNDLYFSNEMDVFPLHDFNLADIVTLPTVGPLNVGTGVCFSHLIAVDPGKTTPGEGKRYNRFRRDDFKYVGYVNPADSTDTTLYTFRGAKVNAFLTLDLKWFFKGVSIFGKEDLKLYSEAAILGVKNYPGWYENRSERIPVMFGFNFPTFKLLDVLSIEAERYSSKYCNSTEYVWKNMSPIPLARGESGDVTYYDDKWKAKTNDDWKWSVYASKKIFNVLRISGQIASDHLQKSPYLPPPPSFTRYTEIVPRTRDWYWMVRVMYMF